VRPMHHVMSAFASVCTAVFVLVFAATLRLKEAAVISIEAWENQLRTDRVWAQGTFSEAFRTVRDLGVESFDGVLPPESGGNVIPTDHDESRRATALVFARETCHHFDRSRPFLSKLAWARPEVPSETLYSDVRMVQQSQPSYSIDRAIELTAGVVRHGLLPQADRAAWVTRFGVIALFVMVQAFPFGAVGWAASRDIRPRM
jgi:hypothetical protein